MTERDALTPFERRVADQMARYVDGATDPKPASQIADAAMRPTSLWSRAMHAPRSRHLLLFGLAAALLVPVAVAGGLIRPSDDASIVQPTRKAATTSGYAAIYVRRSAGDASSVDVVAVRPGGDELVLRTLSDPIEGHKLMLGLGGRVSESGWLALSAVNGENAPSSLILVDLRDLASTPWVVDGATVDMAPAWGPTGLLAATTDGPDLVVVDPDAHTVRRVGMQGIQSSDGASIIWTADGRGFIGSSSTGDFATVPLDGSKPVPGVAVAPYRGGQFGPGMATLQVCADGMGADCAGGNDGRVELVDTNGTQTIWQPIGGDHALAAGFAIGGGYWLTLDHGNGAQVVLTRIGGTGPDLTATVDRGAEWRSVDVMDGFPDHSAVVAHVQRGSDQFLTVIAPLDGTPSTLHHGALAGFVLASDLATPADGRYAAPAESMPHALPFLNTLIANGLFEASSTAVLGKGSHDAVPGDSAVHSYAVNLDRSSAAAAFYLQCIGPSSATVRWSSDAITRFCIADGGLNENLGAAVPITIEATGDTWWRAVIYAQ